jgi:hypothetical protein
MKFLQITFENGEVEKVELDHTSKLMVDTVARNGEGNMTAGRSQRTIDFHNAAAFEIVEQVE